VIGFLFTVYAMVTGGVDTGWTFYTPYSSRASNSNVVMTGLGVFITGFSSILTGLNFMVTIHRMRAPGLTWFRLPAVRVGDLRDQPRADPRDAGDRDHHARPSRRTVPALRDLDGRAWRRPGALPAHVLVLLATRRSTS
jgi:hypothetical protein